MSELIEISASMIIHYTKSPHWIWYDIHGDQSKKNELSGLTLRLIEGGVLHEEDYVKSIQKVEVDMDISEEAAEKVTMQYMKNGEELIYQGVISSIDGDLKLKGRPDLLKKCSGSSKFGDYYYTPIEIKNSTKCDKPEYKKQLMLYALILEKIQGCRPETGGFINKNKEQLPCELTVKLMSSTVDVVGSIMSILRGSEPPLKITKEALDTPWGEVIMAEAKARDDIALLYMIRADAADGLRDVGIKTVEEMAKCDTGALPTIKGAPLKTLEKLQVQARSLIDNEIIQIAKPDIPDARIKIYFDIEGDPFLGVDYLFGFWIVKDGADPEFKYFLAERPEDEQKMWGDFLAWLKAENFSDYKVYHYHHYEKTHLNELSSRYGGGDQLDHFTGNLVDLSPISVNSYILPLYFYSIKDIAKHLKFEWRNAKAGGAQGIFWYEQWLESGNRTILQDVIDYNEDDVRATEFLHNWLLTYKPEK